jgi:hypothetical protein
VSVPEMSTIAVELTLGGARAKIASSNRDFAEYAALHLAPLQPAPLEVEAPCVEATLRWHEGVPPKKRLAADRELLGLRRVDRDLYAGNGHLAWFRIDDLPGLHLRFTWDGDRLGVEGDYHYWVSRNPVWERVKRVVFQHRIPALRQRRFTTLLYYLVYYPCFWWLERHEGFHPMHAGGVEVNGEVMVFAGPSGVGKSTLATAVAAVPGARLLSDTFLLQRGTSVLPVREPLLLDEWSRAWLGQASELLQPIRWRYGLDRGGYHWPQERLSSGGPAAVVLFPHRAAQSYVRPLSPREAHGRISAGNVIVNDLRRYWAYAAVLEMLDSSPLMHERENELLALTAAVPSYEVGLDAGLSREDTVASLARLIPAQGPSSSSDRPLRAGR